MAKEKIVVLGGGVASLAAAFYVTEEAGWSDKYDITVYQQGWRVGGKCASGHDMRPGYGHRILEHGLHIFAGFYDQAFDLLRRAYEVVDRPDHHPNQRVWDAFSSEDGITLVDQLDPEHPNRMWYMDFPPNGQVPGDDLSVPSLMVLLQRLVGTLVQGSPISIQPGKAANPADQTLISQAMSWLNDFIHKTKEELDELIAEAVLRGVIDALEAQIKLMKSQKWDAASELTVERILLSIFLVQSILNGVLADHVFDNGYDSLDKYEWSEWLHQNALAVAKGQNPIWGDPETRAQQLLNFAPTANLYDYVFGYGDGGDTSFRSFAAGTALRAGLLMISYKGHFFWKMRGAMGDVVVAPLYLALLKRGVKFEFFSRITALNIDPADPQIDSIDYVRQVKLKDGAKDYQPLVYVPIPGWPADLPLEGWPAEPLWDQLENGAALQAAGRDFEDDNNDAPGAGDVAQQLRLGVDFDKVILGISVGGLKQVCSSFPARLPQSKWGPMFETITLTRTCAMQVWFTRTLDDLGDKGSDRALAGANQPYSAMSDMSHLLPRETWDGIERPRGIAYFCGQIQGPENGAPADKKAYDLAVDWLKSSSALYWSRATSPTSPYSLDPTLIYDPEPGAAGDVLTRQYIRANCNPSDLYVQSPKNSVFTRMDANQSGVTNLFLTGDWTRNGLNAGAAEAAARSGARCAQAIAGTLVPWDA